VRVSHASSLAQLVVEFDNQADDHRLRLRALPLDAAQADSRVEALGHFAIVERPARPVAPARPWKQDPPGLDHCLGAVRLIPRTEQGELEDRPVLLAGRGIHEYECRAVGSGDGHGLELTVLRSVGWLSRDDIQGRPGHAGPPLATPGAQCHGPHRVELAVGVGAGAAFDQARAFLSPPLVLEPLGTEATLESGALSRARDIALTTPEDPRGIVERLGLRVGGAGVVPSAIKLADDASGDLIVRWWAPARSTDARARLELAAPVAAVQRARLDESPLGPAPFTDGAVEVGVKPGAIVTLRVVLERA
jgi:alpha-mannosidase/mannosylglycerate hydrolase